MRRIDAFFGSGKAPFHFIDRGHFREIDDPVQSIFGMVNEVAVFVDSVGKTLSYAYAFQYILEIILLRLKHNDAYHGARTIFHGNGDHKEISPGRDLPQEKIGYIRPPSAGDTRIPIPERKV